MSYWWARQGAPDFKVCKFAVLGVTMSSSDSPERLDLSVSECRAIAVLCSSGHRINDHMTHAAMNMGDPAGA